MNREIKFRVFDNISKEMYRWSQIASISLVDFYYEHYHLMQYTNLKDRGAIEIYDGDVVEYLGFAELEKMLVYWRNGAWHFKRFESGNIDWEKVDTTEIRVIGNIYENPELLSTN